ncbi:MAG: hypothetical protein EOO08_13540 [Chitinophagaceae bacterium]|nr:MAG: hypothetical protein EOO08_13540 [Chitinophagaceae bacterium]
MKRIGLFCVLLLMGLVAGAQKVYFIYVQSDNGAPFYVRLGEKVSSSTATGYVIVANLRDSSYVLQVGFPGSTAESRFAVSLKGEDKGYVLKQVGGTWNLFDLQELTLTRALAAVGPSEEESRTLLAQADPFTRRLVQASDDLTLLNSGPSPSAPSVAVEQIPPAPMPARPEPEVVQVEVKPTAVDTVRARPIADTTAPVAVSAPPAEAEAPYRRSQVTRRSESSTTEGFGLVFVDNLGEQNDTIRLLIPNPKFVPAAAAAPDSTRAPQAGRVAAAPVADSVPAIAADRVVTPADSTRAPAQAALPVAAPSAPAEVTPTAAVKVDPVAAPKPAGRPRDWAIGNATCAAQAEQKDFFKLRKNMAASEDEGAMVTTARKEFRKRCYSVAQVKLLGTLFLTDLGRYNFFEAAWGHVADQPNFPELEGELKDAYLVNRLYELTRPTVQ